MFAWFGKFLNPVEARREIYVNLYCREVVQTHSYQELETLHQSGDLAIFYFDGYDYLELEMTPGDTIRDLDHSWGHGLLLTFLLEGIDPRNLGW
jgi:hypothetical protein